MSSPTPSLSKARAFPALEKKAAARLAAALEESADTTIFVNGTTLQLPDVAHAALIEVLQRMALGDEVSVSTVESLLNTSQAAKMAGVSASYLRKLTDSGIIPVAYRGTHRRIRPAAVQAWLDNRTEAPTDTPE
ncbi:helix-turn-helix domain-containing protein [Paeniglutamicibacter sulfureus]|uniref:helix-turn-helix domain-containing protein n=1 Tax=Paeniglutamicibacter sulfureus TaxID=43666 RepID=UPI00266591FA|nr:helix-turn-helix domain-containing protein [Paeniglutamicibacter sulfureus]MDO2934893.1 helix-turn-helix domain-containing protein [Paeniglutamicibacter sulfureus]